MNTIGFALAVGFLGAGVVHAQSVPRIPLDLGCPLRHLPSQHAVGSALGMHNFTRAYAERARLLQTAQRDCLRGARDVLVVNRAVPRSDREITLAAEAR